MPGDLLVRAACPAPKLVTQIWFICLHPLIATQPSVAQLGPPMSSAEYELAALRAVAGRLTALMIVKDQLLASKDANLASKDQVIACKDAVLVHIAQELQQYRPGRHLLSSITAIAPDKREAVRLDVWQQQHDSSLEEVAQPLDKNGVLDNALDFGGGGAHLYVSGVSRRWAGRYLRHCALHSASSYDKKFVTRHRSVLTTDSRLQLALDSGLAVSDWTMSKLSDADVICMQSAEPEQVLTLLRLHGMPWDAMLCHCAALHAKLPHCSGCTAAHVPGASLLW
jgi:hypothetical protein